MKWSLIESATDNAPEQQEGTWEDLVDLLGTIPKETAPENKRRAPGLVPFTFSEPGVRDDAHALSTDLLVYDVDSPHLGSLQNARTWLQQALVKHLIYSSPSYHPQSAPQKMRLVIPLANTITPTEEEWRSVYLGFGQQIFGPPVDGEERFDARCRNRSRYFAYGARLPGVKAVFDEAAGDTLHWSIAKEFAIPGEKVTTAARAPRAEDPHPALEDAEKRREFLSNLPYKGPGQVTRKLLDGEAVYARGQRNDRLKNVFAAIGSRMTGGEFSFEGVLDDLDAGLVATAKLTPDCWEEKVAEYRKLGIDKLRWGYDEAMQRKSEEQKAAAEAREVLEGFFDSTEPLAPEESKRVGELAPYILVVPHSGYARWNGKKYGSELIGKQTILDAMVQDIRRDQPDCELADAKGFAANQISFLRQAYGYTRQIGGPIVEGRINLYSPPTIKPIEGDCPELKQMTLVFCGGDEESAYDLRRLLATKIQDPGRMMPSAAVIINPENGTGKQTLVSMLAEMLGPENCDLNVRIKDLDRQFTSSFADKFLCCVDESSSGTHSGSFSLMQTISSMIANRSMVVEAKGKDKYSTQNRQLWIFTSNDLDAVQLNGYSDRRMRLYHRPMYPLITQEYKAMLQSFWGKGNEMWSPIGRDVIARAYGMLKNHETLSDAELNSPLKSAFRDAMLSRQEHRADSFIRQMDEEFLAVAIREHNKVSDPAEAVRLDTRNPHLIAKQDLIAVVRTWAQREGSFSKPTGNAIGKAITKRGDILQRKMSRPDQRDAYLLPFPVRCASSREELEPARA